MASGVRIREVTLDSDWWRQEGPSLLVWDAKTSRPRAAIWTGQKYELSHPQSDEHTPVNSTSAATLGSTAFQFYPGLPQTLTFKSLARFAFQNSQGALGRLFVAALLAMLVGLIVPIATAVVVSTAIPDGRIPLLHEMALLVGVGALGIFALNTTRSLLTIRLETVVNMRLQGAV
ncbi:MAG: hypothetical protein AAGF94_03725 [Pseudomonadota bacterium]